MLRASSRRGSSLTLGKVRIEGAGSLSIIELPMSASHERIVADGDQRYREARDYKAIRARVLVEVSKRFESEKAKASFLRRCWIEVMIRREVHAHMKREFPLGRLHVSAFQNENA